MFDIEISKIDIEVETEEKKNRWNTKSSVKPEMDSAVEMSCWVLLD